MAFLRSAWWFAMIFFPVVFLLYLIWTVYLSIHPWRPFFSRYKEEHNLFPDLEKVSFTSRDGLGLNGWFLSGEKPNIIILLHGLNSSGLGMMAHAKILNLAGYCIFMPDLRAHGSSSGNTVTGVWEVNDVLGALDYLKTRSDIQVDRVGLLGISFGALVGLRTARAAPEIKALVLESIGPATLDDHGGRPTTLIRWLNYPINWTIYAINNFMSGTRGVEGVIDSLKGLNDCAVLFISAGRGKERYFMHMFAQAAKQPKLIWEVPESEHGITIAVRREEYSRKVREFFDRALK